LDETGENLIFLICQPRSGSTLLQSMLGGHPRIHTLPEPWFMLHLLYGLRPDGLTAEYDAGIAQKALVNYLSATSGGRKLYIETIRAAALNLYQAALGRSGKDLYLDKTPRYYLVAEELREVFPKARFIFLVRNPLAVLASILHPLGGDWTALRAPDRMHDLVTAPRNIVRATSAFDGRTSIVRYEDLVQSPDRTLSLMLEQIGIEQAPGLMTYIAIESELGDAKSITKHRTPVSDYIDRWRQDLRSSEKRDVASSYLDELGPDLLERLGYSYRELKDQLGIDRRGKKAGTRWRVLLTPDDEIRWWQRMGLSFAHSRHQRGTWRTILRTAYMVFFGHAPRHHER
jgi:Sulfotransferase family